MNAPGPARGMNVNPNPKQMDAEDFEARYRADIDPWGYTHSAYEQAKYEATLQACGRGPFASALDDVAAVVEDHAPAGEPPLYGLYVRLPYTVPDGRDGADNACRVGASGRVAADIVGGAIARYRPDVLHVQGLNAEQIGTAAWRAHVPVFELSLQQASLEQAFMEITQDSVEYRSAHANARLGEVADAKSSTSRRPSLGGSRQRGC